MMETEQGKQAHNQTEQAQSKGSKEKKKDERINGGRRNGGRREREIGVVKLEDEREWSGKESGVVKVEWSGVFFRLMLISLKIKYGVVEC